MNSWHDQPFSALPSHFLNHYHPGVHTSFESPAGSINFLPIDWSSRMPESRDSTVAVDWGNIQTQVGLLLNLNCYDTVLSFYVCTTVLVSYCYIAIGITVIIALWHDHRCGVGMIRYNFRVWKKTLVSNHSQIRGADSWCLDIHHEQTIINEWYQPTIIVDWSFLWLIYYWVPWNVLLANQLIHHS